MFKHFIITRFNLRSKGWKVTKSGEKVLTDEWLSHRFDLFNRWCYPSVREQVEQNFTWLVYFDILTPEPYKAIIDGLSEGWTNFKPVFIDGHDAFHASILKDIDANTGPEHTHVITSRLDNDDALHCRYTEVVQAAFRGQSFGVIDIMNGFQLVLGTPPIEVRKVSEQANPFISLVEINDKPKTVLSKMHRDWGDCSDKISIRNKSSWLQIIHDKNLLNCTLLENPYTNGIDLGKFGNNDHAIKLMSSSRVLFLNIKRRGILILRQIALPWLRFAVRLKKRVED